MTSRASRRRY